MTSEDLTVDLRSKEKHCDRELQELSIVFLSFLAVIVYLLDLNNRNNIFRKVKDFFEI